MKLLPFLLLIGLVSCGSSTEEIPAKRKNANPENIRFFETYSLKDISGEWLAACKYSAQMDAPANKGEIPLNEMGFRGLRNLVRMAENTGAIGYVQGSDRLAVDSLLANPEIAKMFPKDLVFMWALNPTETGTSPGFYELFAIKMPPGKKARIDGRHIEESVPATDENTNIVTINITMNKEGGHEWELMTRDNINRFIAIVLKDKVLSCPLVMMAITGGKTQISGNFTLEQAGIISDQINGK